MEFIKKAIHPIVNKDKNEGIQDKFVIEGDVLEIGGNIAIESAEQLGCMVEGYSSQPLNSYSEIEVGKTYKVILPNNVTFNSLDTEFVKGTITNVSPESAITTRMAGRTVAGLGLSPGTAQFNAFIEDNKGIEPNTAAVFEITVSEVTGTTNADKLYKYMYAPGIYFNPLFKYESGEIYMLNEDGTYVIIS